MASAIASESTGTTFGGSVTPRTFASDDGAGTGAGLATKAAFGASAVTTEGVLPTRCDQRSAPAAATGTRASPPTRYLLRRFGVGAAVTTGTGTGIGCSIGSGTATIRGTAVGVSGSLYSRVLISPDAVANMSSATSRASAVGGRPPGTFERHCMIISESRRGTSARTSLKGVGSRVRTAASTACGDDATNGDFPVSSSYASNPTA